MRKNLLYITFLLSFILSLTGCGEKRLERIYLDVDKSISINETKKIQVEYEPKEIEEDITWSSSDEKIATIDNGTITAKSVGNVTITATTKSGIKAQVSIEVYQKAESIALDKSDIKLSIGSTSQISAIITPEEVTHKDITWSSEDNTIASVKDGLITAKNVGYVTITATTKDGISAKCNVKVFGKKEYSYYNEKIRWGMSIDEVENILGKGSTINRDRDVYVKYSPKSDDYFTASVDNYVYYFRDGQLRAYWLDFDDNKYFKYNEYLDVRNVLIEKYGNPSSEKYNWKDQAYKNDKDKWADAFSYNDFTIKTTWNKPNFDITVFWDHSSNSYSVSYSQKDWTSKLF